MKWGNFTFEFSYGFFFVILCFIPERGLNNTYPRHICKAQKKAFDFFIICWCQDLWRISNFDHADDKYDEESCETIKFSERRCKRKSNRSVKLRNWFCSITAVFIFSWSLPLKIFASILHSFQIEQLILCKSSMLLFLCLISFVDERKIYFFCSSCELTFKAQNMHSAPLQLWFWSCRKDRRNESKCHKT